MSQDAYFKSELFRLTAALNLMAENLQREKLCRTLLVSERDQLRDALADSKREAATLSDAVKRLQGEVRSTGTNVLQAARPGVH
jgi:hypothetical protein